MCWPDLAGSYPSIGESVIQTYNVLHWNLAIIVCILYARVISLDRLIDPGLMRCLVAKPTEMYLCNYTDKYGIVVLDVW